MPKQCRPRTNHVKNQVGRKNMDVNPLKEIRLSPIGPICALQPDLGDHGDKITKKYFHLDPTLFCASNLVWSLEVVTHPDAVESIISHASNVVEPAFLLKIATLFSKRHAKCDDYLVWPIIKLCWHYSRSSIEDLAVLLCNYRRFFSSANYMCDESTHVLANLGFGSIHSVRVAAACNCLTPVVFDYYQLLASPDPVHLLPALFVSSSYYCALISRLGLVPTVSTVEFFCSKTRRVLFNDDIEMIRCAMARASYEGLERVIERAIRGNIFTLPYLLNMYTFPNTTLLEKWYTECRGEAYPTIANYCRKIGHLPKFSQCPRKTAIMIANNHPCVRSKPLSLSCDTEIRLFLLTFVRTKYQHFNIRSVYTTLQQLAPRLMPPIISTSPESDLISFEIVFWRNFWVSLSKYNLEFIQADLAKNCRYPAYIAMVEDYTRWHHQFGFHTPLWMGLEE